MNIKTLLLTFIAGFSMLMFQSVYAGSMKCGQHIISDGGRTGPGKYEVLKRCGEPAFQQGNTWVYERGEKRRVAVVFKDNGEISSINTL